MLDDWKVSLSRKGSGQCSRPPVCCSFSLLYSSNLCCLPQRRTICAQTNNNGSTGHFDITEENINIMQDTSTQCKLLWVPFDPVWASLESNSTNPTVCSEQSCCLCMPFPLHEWMMRRISACWHEIDSEWISVCACVCVCEREGAGKRVDDDEWYSALHTTHLLAYEEELASFVVCTAWECIHEMSCNCNGKHSPYVSREARAQ